MEKWSFSKIEATRGCKIAFEKRYIQELPTDTEVPEYEQAKRIHEEIEEKFLKKEIDNPVLAMYKDADVFIEKEYNFSNGEIEFIAYPDVIIETEINRLIIDIKCRYDATITDKDKLQLMIYASMAQHEKPVANTTIGIYAVYNQHYPLTTICIEPLSIDFILAEIQKAKRRIPRMTVKTSECQYCEYKRGCDYGIKPIDETNLQLVAEEYLYLKARADMYEEILRKHIELTGEPVQIGEIQLGFFERAYTVINPVEFLKLCKDANIEDFISCVKIDTTKAKKFAKENEILYQAMDKEIKYVFGIKRIKEE